MTIIFQEGTRFWIESILVSVTAADAAGRYFSASTPLARSGTILGVSVGPLSTGGNNDNSQVVGAIEIRDGGGATITLGQQLNNISMRIVKEIGTAGNIILSFNLLVFMRGSGS